MAKDKSPDRLGTGRIGKLLFEFSIPAIVSCVFSALYNVIDAAILGHVIGPDGVAITTLALPVIMLGFGLSVLAGMGGNALAAIKLGAGEKDTVEKILGNTTILLVLLYLVVLALGTIFIDPFLVAIGTPDSLWDLTKVFVQICCIGNIFFSLGGGLNNFLRTAGKPNMSLFTQVFGTAMCFVFNILLVVVLGFGVAGSAWATILGQLCMMVPIMVIFIGGKNMPFKFKAEGFKIDIRLCGKILALGTASFFMQVASAVVSIVFNHVVNIWGSVDPLGVENGLASIGVASKAAYFFYQPVFGITMGMQPIIGYNIGARKWDRVIKTLKWGTLDAFIIGAVFWVLMHVFPGQIVNFFGVSGPLEAFSSVALITYSILMPFVAAQVVSGSYFQSSGQPGKAAFLELIRQVLLLIPLYLFAPKFLADFMGETPLMGIVYCSPVSDFIAIIITAILVGFELKKLFDLKSGKRVA